MTIVISKSIVYREIPTGLPIPDQHFQVVSTELDLDDLALEHGDFVTKTLYLSVDPCDSPDSPLADQRSKMREPSIESYNSAYELNKIMSGGAISQVIQSNNPTFRVGDYVTGGSTRWEEYSVIRRAQASQFRNTTDRIHQVGLPLRHWLNVLGEL
ncbi:chaperonin 10-like protein [Jimgerdemannia flammicorona]|uniref:Chaperonin 10-like protein n=1 Tax=Jimgerdemannia flammicorona TaxID=994334 RepID=A0A433QPS2_9FUNG|nr:chaperonin 10-like protein [Jimgerdemannia flammicorona]